MPATKTRSLVLHIPREWLLTSNQRLHWRRVMERKRWIRQLAALSAPRRPLNGPQRLVVTVAWPDRRHRDTPNIYPTVKAAIDGMVADAGLLPDDSDTFLIGPDMRPAAELCARGLGCALTFDFTSAEVAP